MPAANLNCPSCGASLPADSTSCPHCGHALATTPVPSPAKLNCPHCRIPLSDFSLNDIHLRDCEKCCGIWVGTRTFQQICADREDQAAILGSPIPVPRDQALPNRHYIPCPKCDELMSR